MTFTTTVFIGTSLDGCIARPDDDIEWLTSRGKGPATWASSSSSTPSTP
ncbi:hypothetical protein [Streptomyces sp. URMC 124]